MKKSDLAAIYTYLHTLTPMANKVVKFDGGQWQADEASAPVCLCSLVISAKVGIVLRVMRSHPWVIIFLLTALAGCSASAKPSYPGRWWTRVPTAGASAWEILPQEAGRGEVILSKRNDLGILSNFAPTPFVYHGVQYASVEGFWQMMKYPEGPDDPRATSPAVHWVHTRQEVGQMTAFDAKHAGDLGEQNMKILGIDYVTFEGNRMPYKSRAHGEHYRIIVEAMREKLRQNPQVRQALLATGHLILRPDHHQNPNDPDEWRYFDVWMQFRSELQAGTDRSRL